MGEERSGFENLSVEETKVLAKLIYPLLGIFFLSALLFSQVGSQRSYQQLVSDNAELRYEARRDSQ